MSDRSDKFPGSTPSRIIEDLSRENDRLRSELEKAKRDSERIERERQHLERERDRLRQQFDRLKRQLDAARRAGFRQAAPFSRGAPKRKPAKPGRKRGTAYGRKARRKKPLRIDKQLDAPLPAHCPGCGGDVREERVATQFQTDIPPTRPIVLQFNVHIGSCTKCNRRVQGRHPLQTSDALGAARSQVGPNAVALAVFLNKQLGLSFGKVVTLLYRRFGLKITRSGLVQAMHRAAERAAPSYEVLCKTVRGSPMVVPDETGWKVNAKLWWLHVFTTPETTVYSIAEGRGFAEAAAILGKDFDGTLVRDGWAPYRQFLNAEHQTCLAHLLRRCGELIEDHPQARLPRKVKKLLLAALELRARFQREEITRHGLNVARGKITEKMVRAIESPGKIADMKRFAGHLTTEFMALFTFLFDPAIDATNWRAETGLRPAVITRKVCGGGNRTERGARTQQVLASVLRTAAQREVDPSKLIVSMLRSAQPVVPHALRPPAL